MEHEIRRKDVWTGFIWLRIGTSNVMSFRVPQGFWLAEKLLAYQEGLRPVELFYSEKLSITCPLYRSVVHTTRRRMGSGEGTAPRILTLEKNGLSLWFDRRPLNRMGGHLTAGVHAPTKSASISLLPPVQPSSGVHTYRQNRYRRLQGGEFREWCRAVNMAPMWNKRFCPTNMICSPLIQSESPCRT